MYFLVKLVPDSGRITLAYKKREELLQLDELEKAVVIQDCAYIFAGLDTIIRGSSIEEFQEIGGTTMSELAATMRFLLEPDASDEKYMRRINCGFQKTRETDSLHLALIVSVVIGLWQELA